VPDCSNCGSHLADNEVTCSACGTPTPDATASFAPIGDVSAAPLAAEGLEGPVLVVRKGPQLGERFYLDRERLTVGRDPDSDIFLNDMTVSRAHAVLTAHGGEVTVADSGSLNGTYVNGVCADRATLAEGDVLQIGTFQMVYHSGAGS